MGVPEMLSFSLCTVQSLRQKLWEVVSFGDIDQFWRTLEKTQIFLGVESFGLGRGSHVPEMTMWTKVCRPHMKALLSCVPFYFLKEY